MKGRKRAELQKIKLHEPGDAKRQSFQDVLSLFRGGHVHQEDRSFLIFTNPPLVNFPGQVKENCFWNFPGKNGFRFLWLPRLQKSSNCENLCRRNCRE